MIFILNIDPVAKGRARMGRYGAYTPQKTRDAEQEIQQTIQSMKNCPKNPCTIDCNVTMTFIMPIPSSWSNKKKKEHLEHLNHQSRPDIDNLVKLVADSLNGILWVDDCQIHTITATKKWGETGKIIITLNE